MQREKIKSPKISRNNCRNQQSGLVEGSHFTFYNQIHGKTLQPVFHLCLHPLYTERPDLKLKALAGLGSTTTILFQAVLLRHVWVWFPRASLIVTPGDAPRTLEKVHRNSIET